VRRQLGVGEPVCDTERKRASVCLRIDAAVYSAPSRREALQLPEPPDPRYFCYCDDFDFTYCSGAPRRVNPPDRQAQTDSLVLDTHEQHAEIIQIDD